MQPTASGLTLAAMSVSRASLDGDGTAGSGTALQTARRDRLTAAPGTGDSLDAAGTTGEGGP